MIALLVALVLAAPPAVQPAAAPPQPPAPPSPQAAPPALTAEQAVDKDGVPAWARRKRMAPVQNCTGRPNIGVEAWRQELDPNSKVGARRSVPIKTTCK